LWVLGYEAGIYKTGNCLKSLPDWYWFHQVGIASSPYQTGTGFIRLVLPQVTTKLVLVSSGWYCLKSLPNWYWFHQLGIASSPYQTGTGIRYFTQEGEGTSLGANSLSLSLFPG